MTYLDSEEQHRIYMREYQRTRRQFDGYQHRLRREAEIRGVSPLVLRNQLLKIICDDDLFAAILEK